MPAREILSWTRSDRWEPGHLLGWSGESHFELITQGGPKRTSNFEALSFIKFLSVFARFFQKIIPISLGGCSVKMKVMKQNLLKIS